MFVRNPLNRELVATFEIIVSVHDNASEVIDKSGSVPNGMAEHLPLSFNMTNSIMSIFSSRHTKPPRPCIFILIYDLLNLKDVNETRSLP